MQRDAAELLDLLASTVAVRAVESCGGSALAMASGALQATTQGGARHGTQGRGAGACRCWVYMGTRRGRVRGGYGTDTRESGVADSGRVRHGHELGRARLGLCWAKSNPVPRKRVQGARANFKISAEQLTWVGTERSCGRSWRSKGGLPRMGLAQKKRKVFLFFEFNFQCENISKKS
jgi:hypothetical protein